MLSVVGIQSTWSIMIVTVTVLHIFRKTTHRAKLVHSTSPMIWYCKYVGKVNHSVACEPAIIVDLIYNPHGKLEFIWAMFDILHLCWKIMAWQKNGPLRSGLFFKLLLSHSCLLLTLPHPGTIVEYLLSLHAISTASCDPYVYVHMYTICFAVSLNV